MDKINNKWDESKHPRNEDGTFAKKESGIRMKKDTNLMDASNSENEGLTNESSRNIIKGQRKKLKSLTGKPDGTYDLETGEPISHTSGYQVSFQRTNDTYTDEEFDAKIAEMIERTGSKAHGGVYKGVAEVSFHVNSLDEAMKIAIEYNQHSIFNWSNKELILNPHYIEQKNKIKR